MCASLATTAFFCIISAYQALKNCSWAGVNLFPRGRMSWCSGGRRGITGSSCSTRPSLRIWTCLVPDCCCSDRVGIARPLAIRCVLFPG
ncbi:hypothetical protein PF005_g4535 [Phytophthora fragariae]|uniref:Secreted protein n=1 Tax=Phytophthora fragariae TaxID=53985 RepID=A0A6A3RRB3_9STRA|nr:hypothetical protein PF009_g20952 [Phytophthora fragariae]KAE8983570.1 hypothetical protein PF011_g21127 [Phytophthora fragariae]KAE9102422.1 hypothetical protein PF006_g22428 [Phytophthora fragariae]KAE9116043.1 hypothetical protein PF010_g9104 [Phytophthora fragariae]KAE9130325.1 hypothetical protein PF007_g4562 [Phytophthora fragariae]